MSKAIENARAVLARLEGEADAEAASALREMIGLTEGLFEDLDHFNAKVARAAAAIGAKGCPVDQLYEVIRYVERAAPHFRYVAASGELIGPKLDEYGGLQSVFIGPIEIRRNHDGTLDEVVARNADVHLEQMAENAWWMGVSTADDAHRVHVNFYSQAAIDAEAEDQNEDQNDGNV